MMERCEELILFDFGSRGVYNAFKMGRRWPRVSPEHVGHDSRISTRFSRVSNMEIVLIVLGVAAVGGIGAYFFLFRSRRPKEEPVYHYRCAKCKRKMRYLARQANSKGICPQCKQRFVFPAIPAPTKTGRPK
jgi:DNA-directed RNA polymerase subunit RPC12/RpoP